MSYVYMLQCNDNTYYTGWTTNPQNRLKTHNMGKGAKFTRCRLPVSLIYLEKLPSKGAALSREIAIKKLKRPQKDLLVAIYKAATENRSPFTPICWTTSDPYIDSNQEFPWNIEKAQKLFDNDSHVLIDISKYPAKTKKAD